MDLSPASVSVMLLLTDLLVTGVLGFQVYLFRQISFARREHLEFRIKIAEEYVRDEHLDKALSKLEENLERRLTALLNTSNKRN
ncbi:MAG: hypothetical protein ACRES5_16060 [Pseudomonas sp.]|uniref:hypothetical protein n=1 Tax=Pseudomonas putida TaxID=303 RepID=UPI003D99ED51